MAATSAPAGNVRIVWGFEAGRVLVLDPHIKAAGAARDERMVAITVISVDAK